jgi:hypothetical protein
LNFWGPAENPLYIKDIGTGLENASKNKHLANPLILLTFLQGPQKANEIKDLFQLS